MATFKIEELFGSAETVTEPSHAKNKPMTKKAVGQVRQYQEHRPRTETEELIKTAIRDAGKALTFNSIARALNRSTSPFLRNILMDMVKAGQLVETVDVPNNAKMVRYWYSLP